MTVRVAIDLALDRLFDYEVPEALREKLAVGQLLSVPFGHREARGFAMALGKGEGTGQETGDERQEPGLGQETRNKRLENQDVRREAPHVSHFASRDLTSRVSSSCVSPSPSPLSRDLTSRVSSSCVSPSPSPSHRPLKSVTAIVDETPFFSPALLELVRKIAAYTAAPIESVLRAALPASVLKKNVKPRELMFIEPALGAAPVALTKRQKWLYDQIVRLGGGWMTQLCEELKTTPATVKELGRLGLVSVAVRARRRDPLAGRKILPTKPLALNGEQQAALEAIAGGGQETGDERQEQGGGQETGDERQEPGAGQETRNKRLENQDVRRETPHVSHFASRDLTSRVSSSCVSLLPSPSPASRDLTSRVSSSCVSPSSRDLTSRVSSSCVSPSPSPASRDLTSRVSSSCVSPSPSSRDLPLRVSSPSSRDLTSRVSAPASRDSCLATSPSPRPLLLYGVTGSGKTEVYLQAIARELEKGRGAIVLVPEIALTPQTVARFAGRFGDKVAVLHSALSDGERYDEWHRIRSGAARVVIGPRSAVFAPVRNLGLIVVDEEHESSYKQEENPRYHARDVAVLRGAIEGARVVLGSATPSLETWRNAETGKYARATLTRRAGLGTMPNVLVVDMKETAGHPSGGAIFSPQLLEAVRRRLDRHEQTILFLNRRGYSRSVVCEDCGHVLACDACDLPYTYHRADACLRCHVCGGWRPLPAACPACGARSLSYKGIGTQRAEAALKACCPRAAILRMDADSTSRKNSHDDILSAFRRGEADVLLGTQMIAKGLDFPNVTLVGVLNAGSSLAMPDFRAAERTYQLLAQVAGRAGRAELPGEVIIQAWDPDAFAIRAAARGDFAAFAARELADRAEGWFPPYCHLATLNLKSPDLNLVASWADMYAKSLQRYAARGGFGAGAGRKGRFEVGEAVPSALEKADGSYRWQIVLRAEKPSAIVSSWRWILSVRPPKKNLTLALDLDAQNLV